MQTNGTTLVLLWLTALLLCLVLVATTTSPCVRPCISYVDYDATLTVDAPVDAVYTWVNPGEQEWQTEYKKHVPSTDLSNKRFNNKDAPDAELQTSLELLLRHCPWVQTVYIATMRPQVPPCLHTRQFMPLVKSGKIRVVHHDEFFPDRRVLPVFNSHAIEANLHRIPGLAKRWLYLNDDMMVGRPVEKNMLFHEGRPVIRGLWMPVHLPFKLDAHVSACANSGKVLKNLWYFHNDHTPAAVHSDAVERVAHKVSDAWQHTAHARLRDHNQVVPLGLVENDALDEKEYVCYKKSPLKTYAMLSSLLPWTQARMRRQLPQYHFFCINNIAPGKVVQTVNNMRAAFNLAPLTQ